MSAAAARLMTPTAGQIKFPMAVSLHTYGGLSHLERPPRDSPAAMCLCLAGRLPKETGTALWGERDGIKGRNRRETEGIGYWRTEGGWDGFEEERYMIKRRLEGKLKKDTGIGRGVG